MQINFGDQNMQTITWQLSQVKRLPRAETPLEMLQEGFNIVGRDLTAANPFGMQLILADLTYISQLKYGFRRGWKHPENRLVVYGHWGDPRPPLPYVAVAAQDMPAERALDKLHKQQQVTFYRHSLPETLLVDPFANWMSEASPIVEVSTQLPSVIEYLKTGYLVDEDQFGWDINLQSPYLQEFVLPSPDFFAFLEHRDLLDADFGNNDILEKLSRIYPTNGIGHVQVQLELDLSWTTMLKVRLVDGIGEPLRLDKFIHEETMFNLERPYEDWRNKRVMHAQQVVDVQKQGSEYTQSAWQYILNIAKHTDPADILKVLPKLKAKLAEWEHHMGTIEMIWASQANLDFEKGSPKPAQADRWLAIPEQKLRAMYWTQIDIDKAVDEIVRDLLSEAYYVAGEKVE